MCISEIKKKKFKNKKKENCFANLKEREESQWCYPPPPPSLGDCTAREEDLASMNGLRSMKLAVVNVFLCSPVIASENSLDDTKQGAKLLGLQVQSVVARVKFSREETRGLYQTLGEQLKKLFSFFVKQPTKQFPILCPQLHQVIVKHKV
jgi:hypothetical protein